MQTIQILIDHREKVSGISEMLSERQVKIGFAMLRAGDYVINTHITVERKTSEDFIQSIIHNRLFEQCKRLKGNAARPLIIIEGNPYTTRHNISPEAVKGALLSVMVAWQIPVIHAKNREDCLSILLGLGKQDLKSDILLRPLNGYKPKRIGTHRLRFLQGLPRTGPKIAYRLYDHFGSIRSVMHADAKQLRSVTGIGKKSAEMIVQFLDS